MGYTSRPDTVRYTQKVNCIRPRERIQKNWIDQIKDATNTPRLQMTTWSTEDRRPGNRD